MGRGRTTGIQRVQEALVAALLDREDDVEFVFVDGRYGRVWRLERARMVALVQFGNSNGALARKAQSAESLRDDAKPVACGQRDILVNLGAFWPERYTALLTGSFIASRCRYVPIVYDMIPIDHPTMCEANTVRQFSGMLRPALRIATALLAISAHTDLRVQVYGLANKLRIPPVHVLPLAHALPRMAPTTADAPFAVAASLADNFVLCVGTIEPRKNQLRLAEAWHRVTNAWPDAPTLVFVGTVGWIESATLERIAELARKSGKIVLAHNVSDEELAVLYQNCIFTVFMSIDEGWGLPVGESLAFGKVCLAARTGAIPEVGGEFVVYADPLDLESIADALQSLLRDPTRRKALEAKIRREFRPRQWPEVASRLIATIETYRGTEALKPI